MAASEATPFAKTGGLADVLGALPRALKARGEEVAVVLPRYGHIKLDGARRVFNDLRIWFGPASWRADLYVVDQDGVPVYLVDCPALFDRETLYGAGGADYPDNHIRFAVFSRAVLAVMRWLFRPDIVHCHDWQAALVPILMRHPFAGDPTFYGIRTLLTIHNLGYQGLFPRDVLPEIGLDESLYKAGVVEYWGQVNLLKGGILTADHLSTVSRDLRARDPDARVRLRAGRRAAHPRRRARPAFSTASITPSGAPRRTTTSRRATRPEDLSGKRECKRDLLGEFGLPAEQPRAPADRHRVALHRAEGLRSDRRGRPGRSRRGRDAGRARHRRPGVRAACSATWPRPIPAASPFASATTTAWRTRSKPAPTCS